MPIAAIPQGVELRKISAVQKRAIDDLLKKQKESNILETAVGALIPTLGFVGVATAGIVVAWSYLKDIDLPTPKEVAKAVAEGAGGVVADVIIDTGGAIAKAVGFEDNPATPEYISAGGRTIGPLSRCKRWELDSNDWHHKTYDSGKLTKSETVQAALAAKRIIKNMKAEGCDKPPAFTHSPWDE